VQSRSEITGGEAMKPQRGGLDSCTLIIERKVPVRQDITVTLWVQNKTRPIFRLCLKTNGQNITKRFGQITVRQEMC